MFTPANANSLLDAARDFAGGCLNNVSIAEAEERIQAISRMVAGTMMCWDKLRMRQKSQVQGIQETLCENIAR